jgi:predicted transport protein
MLNVMKVASELNQMTAKDLQLVSEFLSKQTSEALSNYIAFTLQEKDLLDIEVQESVC